MSLVAQAKVRAVKRTHAIIALSIGLLAGLAVVRVSVPSVSWNLPAAIGVVLAGLLIIKKFPVLVVFTLGGLVLGWWRGTVAMRSVRPIQDLYGQKVTIRGVATLDGVYGDKADLTFRLQADSIVAPHAQKVNVLINVGGFGVRSVVRGDVLEVTGKLTKSRGAAIGRMSFAEIVAVSRPASPLERLRLYFGAGLQSALPEPQGSLGLGLLIGQRTTLSKEFQDQLTTVGLVHIIAVSGYNLTILVTAARKLCDRLSKYQSLILSLLLIALFLAISGLAASLVRAAVISLLSLGAGFYGRQFKPVVLLLLSAAITAFANPQYVWFDIGWYLSFAAFAGVILVSPALHYIVFRGREPKLLGGLVVETISAQITTLPLILMLFGRLSIISLPANIAIVPLLPLTMLFSMIAGLAGLFHMGILVGIVAWPAKMLLGYIVEATYFFAAAPMAEVSLYISVATMMIIYGAIAMVLIIVYRHMRKTSRNTLEYAII